MLVNEAMTRQVVTIAPEETVKEAARRLALHAITAMPVVTGAGRLVGVVSAADVVRESFETDERRPTLPGADPALATCVVDVMTTLPSTVSPETDLRSAARMMTHLSVQSLPVVDRGLLIGIVSRTDVIALLSRGDDQVDAEIHEGALSSGKE